MRSQPIKDAYFAAMTPATLINHVYWQHRFKLGIPDRFRRGPAGEIWLNIGSGGNPHDHFINVDANVLRKPDLWLNLTNGFPFPDRTIDGIYAAHVLEHLYWQDLVYVLSECRRILSNHGCLRMLVPSLELAVDAYRRGDSEWFSDFPVCFASLGGRLQNFLFCDGQHRLSFDSSFAVEALNAAGFGTICQSAPRISRWLPERILNTLEPPVGHIETSLVIEAMAIKS